MATDYEFTIIGAGVVGLAVAAELALQGSVLVIEKEWKFGQATSSHNSEVVHAGLYYTPGTFKARLCVEGNRLIRELAENKAVGYQRVGKYIVATSESENDYLTWLKNNAAAGGVEVRWAELDELHEQEPDVFALASLFSPTTGIVDSHGLMAHFKTAAELEGSDFVFSAEVVAIRKIIEGYAITVRDSDGADVEITSHCVINAAGLHSDEIAQMIGLNADSLRLHWTRGFYYALENSHGLNIRHLVYPVPDKSLKSLGVHATVDLQGGVRFGPTAEYMNDRIEDYGFTASDHPRVIQSISRYLPALANAAIHPIMAGIRPKLTRPGESPRDFYIREESDKGLPGFVNLIGIESPGLTAAPAIAQYVSHLLSS
jgi:L-2-hydroxyglutarate oxidase LhgO